MCFPFFWSSSKKRYIYSSLLCWIQQFSLYWFIFVQLWNKQFLFMLITLKSFSLEPTKFIFSLVKLLWLFTHLVQPPSLFYTNSMLTLISTYWQQCIKTLLRGSKTQWTLVTIIWLVIGGCLSKNTIASLSKKHNRPYSILIGSRNGYKHDLHLSIPGNS